MNTFKFNVNSKDGNDMSVMWATIENLEIKQKACAKIDMNELFQKNGMA